MICYYFEEKGARAVVVPRLFTARIADNAAQIVLDPDCLEQTAYELVSKEEMVEENVKIGKWRRLEIEGQQLKDICSLCIDGKTYEAGRVAVDVCREVLEHIKLNS